MKALRRTAGNLTLAVLSTAVGLVVAEQILRLVDYQINPLRVEIRNTGDARHFHVFHDRHFVYDPALLWRPRRGFEVFNSQGFRGPVLSERKEPGSLRVVAVGDSNTLGWRGEEGANWPEYLDDLLRADQKDARVVNAGVYGYSSHQGRIRFRECLNLQPDVVLISFGSNDAQLVSIEDRLFTPEAWWAGRLDRALRSYRLGQMVASVWQGLRRPSAGPLGARVPLDQYEVNLRAMIRLGRSQGVEVILLTRPYTGSLRYESRWKDFAHHYNAATQAVAESEQVTLVDIYSHFKARPNLFADESHFTAEGHRLAAAILYEEFRRFLPVATE